VFVLSKVESVCLVTYRTSHWLKYPPIILFGPCPTSSGYRRLEIGNWRLPIQECCRNLCSPAAQSAPASNKESDRKTPFERRKIVCFFKSTLPTAIFGINSSRVTVSDHFYWFLFIKSVNIKFYLAKVCFFPYLLLIKIVKYTCWEFQMLMYNNKTANDINSSKHNSCIKKTWILL
jgi:hypothetical protein